MTSKVLTNSYELLDSGILILDWKEQEIILYPSFGNGELGNIHILFETDELHSNARLEQSVQGQDLYLRFVNFNSSLGTGSSHAIEIGSIGSKKLYCHIWVYLLSENQVRKVEYNFYRER